MVIAAHPDDAESGRPGPRTLDRMRVRGWLVCCTSGDQGGEDPDADRFALSALRETEQRAAASSSGYAGSASCISRRALANDLALREQLVREIRTFRPDAVLATDPETIIYKGAGSITDHRAAGIAAIDASIRRRGPDGVPVARPERTAPTRSAGLPLLVRPERHGIDVSAPLERKIEALRAHASQIHDPEAWPTGSGPGRREGSPIGATAAEALRIVIIDDDEDEWPGDLAQPSSSRSAGSCPVVPALARPSPDGRASPPSRPT